MPLDDAITMHKSLEEVVKSIDIDVSSALYIGADQAEIDGAFMKGFPHALLVDGDKALKFKNVRLRNNMSVLKDVEPAEQPANEPLVGEAKSKASPSNATLEVVPVALNFAEDVSVPTTDDLISLVDCATYGEEVSARKFPRVLEIDGDGNLKFGRPTRLGEPQNGISIEPIALKDSMETLPVISAVEHPVAAQPLENKQEQRVISIAETIALKDSEKLPAPPQVTPQELESVNSDNSSTVTSTMESSMDEPISLDDKVVAHPMAAPRVSLPVTAPSVGEPPKAAPRKTLLEMSATPKAAPRKKLLEKLEKSGTSASDVSTSISKVPPPVPPKPKKKVTGEQPLSGSSFLLNSLVTETMDDAPDDKASANPVHAVKPEIAPKPAALLNDEQRKARVLRAQTLLKRCRQTG
jgi:hypothetical protein